jgi:hypothetical protein
MMAGAGTAIPADTPRLRAAAGKIAVKKKMAAFRCGHFSTPLFRRAPFG